MGRGESCQSLKLPQATASTPPSPPGTIDSTPGGKGYSLVACFSHLTIDHAIRSRQSTVPTPNKRHQYFGAHYVLRQSKTNVLPTRPNHEKNGVLFIIIAEPAGVPVAPLHPDPHHPSAAAAAGSSAAVVAAGRTAARTSSPAACFPLPASSRSSTHGGG